MKYQITISGSIGCWPNVANAIKPVLDDYKDKHIDVLITSPGGSVLEALAIRDLFAEHGDVTVHIQGYAASAATIIAMGAKHIAMSKYALFLVHQVSNWVDEWGYMNADQIQEVIDNLIKVKDESSKFDLLLAKIYADRTGNSIDTMHTLMVQNVWLSAEEALENKLVDEVVNSGNAPIIDASTRDLFNSLDIPLPDRFNSPMEISSAIDKLIALVSNLSNNLTPKKTMKKVFAFSLLSALLAKDSFEAEDNVVSMSSDDLAAIENRLLALENSVSAKDTEIQNLKNSLTEKDNQIAALTKAPADEPDEVHDEGKDIVSCIDIMREF